VQPKPLRQIGHHDDLIPLARQQQTLKEFVVEANKKPRGRQG